MAAGRLLQVATPGELWRAPASREVAEFLGYEAFVPVSSPAADPWRAALGLADGDPRTLALAPGSLVIPSHARGNSVVGTVVVVGARRGHTEATVDVAGIGRLTALAPPGWSTVPGAEVALRVDPDGIALLP